MKLVQWLTTFPFTLILVSTFASPVHAQSVKGFFAGKTITMLAGSSPGGGTDQTVRLIARHMERYIPGKPTIVVVNKPGAGGLIAVNELYNLRKPDGLTMSNINTGAIFAVAGGNDAIKFDLQKIIYVGQALDEAQTVYVKSSTPYTSLEAIKKANKEGKQPRMGAQSLDHTSSFVVKVMEHILGLDFLVIPGYPGTPEILLDIERGALDGRSQGTGSLMATKREWLKSGYIKPLVTSRKTRDARVPGVPSIMELAPAGSKGLLSTLYAAQNIGRSIGLPPGVPPERVKELRDAFAAMTKDEEFLKEADKIGLEVGLIRGEDLNRDIENTLRDKRMMDLYRMIAAVK
ncbi:MAG TPA: tripartite tricarboxylate transporter substrate-binding protein [Candidatus Binatia bacterium]|jgi:tripartite-type tricarboxylate transporter receptor subunit TctC|nr:tripartite tricarboxylate transporter substrate-binding protein [Candidatus Binatia bacterium]